jgi:ribosomal protein S18
MFNKKNTRGGRRPKKKVCSFCVDKVDSIDYKDIRDIINSQIVTYSKKAKYAEMANEIIENEQDEEMKDVWKAILK